METISVSKWSGGPQMKISSGMKAIAIAASALSLAAVAAPASAGVVTFQTSGQWTNWVGGSNVDVTNKSNGDAEIAWGGTRRNPKESSYVFDAKNVGQIGLGDGDTSNVFTLAEFTHNNKSIVGEGITSVDLVFNTKIFVDGEYATERNYTWTFNHDETTDTWAFLCPYGSSGFLACNDKVTVADSGDFGGAFQVGDDFYSLSLSGFQTFNGSSWANKSSFITGEGASSTAKIRGQLSMTTITSAVPEPATWAMMIVGFFGAGSALRSNRRKGLMATAA
jgi:hypothetical protein